MTQAFALALLLAFAGCRSNRDGNQSNSSSESGQTLRVFKMQDIQNGKVAMELEAPNAQLIDEQQLVRLQRPKIRFMKNGQTSATLQSAVGEVDMKTHYVKAWGGVYVETHDKAALSIESLHYDPEKDRLISKDPLTIERPDSITEGIGFEATPDLRTIRIGKQRVRMKSGSWKS